MDRAQFSLARLMTVVFFIALGIAALLNPTPVWASVLFLFTVALMSAAVVGAITGRGKMRMTWAGVAIFGWIYLGIVFGPLPNGNGTTIPALPTMLIYEYTLDQYLIPQSKAAYKDVIFENTNQAESLLDKATLRGKPRVLVDVMHLKRVVHCLGALIFAVIGGFVGRFLYSRGVRAYASA
jgi:hypothetical protein